MRNKLVPFVVNMELTSRCLLKCKQCYKLYQNTVENEIEIKTAKKYIEEIAKIGKRLVLFSGGDKLYPLSRTF